MGPGALPSDAFMMGIDVQKQRDRMDEAIGVLVPLMRGETVNYKSDWFELCDARLQLVPYTRPHIEMCVASQVSPAGARAAGKHGLGLLSIGATTTGGFNMLAANWKIAEDKASEHGKTVDRNAWRLVGPMHVAETREKARENVRFGLGDWLRYFQEVAALPLAPPGNVDDAVDALLASGFAVIGDPDDAAAQLDRLVAQSGGFGCFLQMATNWADFPATLRSYELIARYVMPRFQASNDARRESMEWATKHRPRFMGAVAQAIGSELQKHTNELAARKQKTTGS
jgi:limonene 1,2-monooxygenase